METPPHDNTNHLHTARRQTRSALSEIPVRLGMLAVTDGGTTLIEETQTTPLNTRFLHGDMWNFNLPPSYLTPSPSPDELVIQQRGRRRVPLTFSPDIDTQKEGAEGRNTRDCTPVKNNGSSSPMKYNIVRRNTPRKRLVLNDPKEMIGSPEKNKTRPSTSPNAKKIRVERTGFSCSLQAALKGLSQEQLIDVIQNLVEKHPGLESEMKVSLPPPDLKPLEERLNHLKKNIFKSLPNSRLSSKTDSAAYTRAATHVTDFKKCVLDQGRTLLESQHWDSVMEYVLLAWTYVRATPLWDNPLHNTARRQCFKFLASQCMTALKKGAWNEDQASILKTKIEALVVDSEDVHSCLKQLESICF